MSLKKKTEQAILGVIETAAFFTGKRLTSQENQTSNVTSPSVVAVATELKHFKTGKGVSTGRVHYRLDLLLFGKADKAKDALVNPEDTHAANVELVRQSVHIVDLAGAMSDEVSAFHCFATHPRTPANMKPPPNSFLDCFAWEVIVCETDCS
jgi:hypothetical protein